MVASDWFGQRILRYIHIREPRKGTEVILDRYDSYSDQGKTYLFVSNWDFRSPSSPEAEKVPAQARFRHVHSQGSGSKSGKSGGIWQRAFSATVSISSSSLCIYHSPLHNSWCPQWHYVYAIKMVFNNNIIRERTGRSAEPMWERIVNKLSFERRGKMWGLITLCCLLPSKGTVEAEGISKVLPINIFPRMVQRCSTPM